MILEITEAGDMKSINLQYLEIRSENSDQIRQNGYIYKDLHAKKDNTA